jgi:hypothetical protein
VQPWFAAICIGAAFCLYAQQPDTTAAETALSRMAAAYKSLPALHVKARSSAKYSGAMSADDFPLPGPDTFELRMQRPNKLFLSAASRRGGRSSSYVIVSDGVTLSCWRSWAKSIPEAKAPATLAEIARLLPDDVIGTSVDGTWEAQTIPEFPSGTC